MAPFVLFLSLDDDKSAVAQRGGPPPNQTVCIACSFYTYCKLTHIVT